MFICNFLYYFNNKSSLKQIKKTQEFNYINKKGDYIEMNEDYCIIQHMKSIIHILSMRELKSVEILVLLSCFVFS